MLSPLVKPLTNEITSVNEHESHHEVSGSKLIDDLVFMKFLKLKVHTWGGMVFNGDDVIQLSLQLEKCLNKVTEIPSAKVP